MQQRHGLAGSSKAAASRPGRRTIRVRRVPLILLGVAAVAGLGFLASAVTQGFEQVTRAEQERQRLLERRDQLQQRITTIETTLEEIRNRPEAVESLARRELGWVRPGERIIILATPTAAPLPAATGEPSPTPILSLAD